MLHVTCSNYRSILSSCSYYPEDFNYRSILVDSGIIVHCSRYDEKSTNNDIALLKLKQKIDFKKYSGTVTPVCLPDLPRKYYGELVSEMLESVVVLQTKSK